MFFVLLCLASISHVVVVYLLEMTGREALGWGAVTAMAACTILALAYGHVRLDHLVFNAALRKTLRLAGALGAGRGR